MQSNSTIRKQQKENNFENKILIYFDWQKRKKKKIKIKKHKMELLKYKTNMNLHSLSIHSHHYSFISIWKKIVITFKRRKKITLQ